ncbi:MAG: carbon storage regulator CsrA [Planctomycetia bacterium]|jgi:carbon storage regulator|nr:carbon storage regulator CsrA [Planctomycetia bacterium]
MLVLSRQRDESIMIGDNIEITIVDVRGDKVRLGITAPNTVPIHRKEVYETLQRTHSGSSQPAAAAAADSYSVPTLASTTKPPEVPPDATAPPPAI